MIRFRGEANASSTRSRGERAATLIHSIAPVSSNRMKFLVLLMAILLATGTSESGLRLLWHNPYRRASPERLLTVRMHLPNIDRVYSRALLDAKHSRGRLRTDSRSYILPSF